jgi:menaquinone-specific isochorismate synthase
MGLGGVRHAATRPGTVVGVRGATTRVDDGPELRPVGPDQLFWRGPDRSLVGHGIAARIPLDRAGRSDGAAAAQAALAELGDTGEAAGAGGVPIVAFAALPFDPDAPGELVVPEVVLERRSDGTRRLTVLDGSSPDEALDRLTSPVPSPPQPMGHELLSVLAPELWRDEIVAVVRDRIAAGELDKAVLARELRLCTDRPIDVAALVSRLCDTHPAALVFAVEGFVGASPELLVSRHDDRVEAHPLAGTAPRRADPEADRRGAADLLASTKDQWEHRIVIEWFLDELLAFTSYVDAEPEPSIISLPNVHHLGTRIEGRLSSPPASVLELVAALHPTPAVGGRPQATALAVIAETERADRGRYAGPVGWVDAEGNGAFAVGIRSAEIDGATARLFAGVGVVADSDPEAELAETRAKFGAMLGAILRP